MRGGDVRRPHHIFLIDGSRGAGKTYTLLSLEIALQRLSDYARFGLDPEEREQKRANQVSTEWASKLTDWVGSDAIRALQQRYMSSSEKLGHVLRIIFPGDMETGENAQWGDSFMEALFAAMSSANNEAAEQHDDERGRKQAEEAVKLNDRLREEVAKGWYFARHFGYDAIVQDSTNYEDLVSQFEIESRQAAQRIGAWRAYVDDYLEFHQATCLVVLLDDSDVRPELTEDILHSIRMFLNHPRIVTVLAGNLKAMRNSLLHLAMRRIGGSIAALNSPDHRTGLDWRRSERETIEEYLEKVLPPDQRIAIVRPHDPEDFKKITGGATIGDICDAALRVTRVPFLPPKFKLAIRRELGQPDAPDPREQKRLENFLSWWVFYNRYLEALEPRSARQIITFASYYNGYRWDAKKNDSFKRLVVALYDIPANYTLIQRLGDEDSNLLEWLRRQDLSSSWSGRRLFRINRREADEGKYTYDYLRYRMDVGLSMPVRDNPEEIVPSELLPRPIGRRFMRRFFQPREMPRRHRRLGICRWVDHAAMPSNCIYFQDIAAIPDASFAAIDELKEGPDRLEALQSGEWEAKLCDNWPEVLEDRQEEGDDENLVRYFKEIVCESLRGTENIPSGVLLGELDPSDIVVKQTQAIYEHFIRDEIDSFRTPDRIAGWRNAFREKTSGDLEQTIASRRTARTRGRRRESEPIAPLGRPWQTRAGRMLALYSAMITDLRRGWHAVLIHRASPSLSTGTDVDDRSQRAQGHAPTSVIGHRDRMKLYTYNELLQVLEQSPWVRTMLQVFQSENIINATGAARGKPRPDTGLNEAEIEKLFMASSWEKEDLRKKIQIVEEREDFDEWTKTLRAVGRAICDGWPIQEKGPLNKETTLFSSHPTYRLPIFKDPEYDPNLAKQNGRSARNFVWLLYGLAPSLSAMIHSHIMGKIYAAELRYSVFRVKKEEYLRQRQSDFEGQRGRILAEADQFYRRSLTDLEDWARLVGALAAALRYVKMKCLHLDAWLFISQIKELPQPPHGDSARLQLLRRCQYEFKTDNAERVCSQAFDHLDKRFGTFKEQKIETDLAIMPDVSPSTLFGDQWISDLLQRGGISKELEEQLGGGLKMNEDRERQSEDPLSVNGVFGETEQWLWAASRSMRKLYNVIKEKQRTALVGT